MTWKAAPMRLSDGEHMRCPICHGTGWVISRPNVEGTARPQCAGCGALVPDAVLDGPGWHTSYVGPAVPGADPAYRLAGERA